VVDGTLAMTMRLLVTRCDSVRGIIARASELVVVVVVVRCGESERALPAAAATVSSSWSRFCSLA